MSEDPHAGKAAQKLQELLPGRIIWLAESCYPRKVGEKLGELRSMLLAAQFFGVKGIPAFDSPRPLLDDEAAQGIVTQIEHLRSLEMAEEARELLYRCMKDVGIPDHYYLPTPQ